MNEWKKKCVGLQRAWVSKRTVQTFAKFESPNNLTLAHAFLPQLLMTRHNSRFAALQLHGQFPKLDLLLNSFDIELPFIETHSSRACSVNLYTLNKGLISYLIIFPKGHSIYLCWNLSVVQAVDTILFRKCLYKYGILEWRILQNRIQPNGLGHISYADSFALCIEPAPAYGSNHAG